MKPVVLFGCGKIAEVILHGFQQLPDREVVACTVNRAFLPGPEWNGLSTVAFEDVAETYPPGEFDLFVALGYQDLNELRARKCAEARALGYTLPSLVHPEAGLPSDCMHGDNCFIMHHVMIHPRVRLGNNVFVWSGALIGHHSVIGDNCWITSGANLAGVVTLGENCFLAINATVGHGVTIGKECFLGANSLVTHDVKDGEVFAVESTKSHRLNSRQFWRLSGLSEL